VSAPRQVAYQLGRFFFKPLPHRFLRIAQVAKARWNDPIGLDVKSSKLPAAWARQTVTAYSKNHRRRASTQLPGGVNDLLGWGLIKEFIG
jgi:hypothetical protein